MNGHAALFAACIPTKDRPQAVHALLNSLLDQVRSFDAVLVVDSSENDATRDLCADLAPRFSGDMLRYERCPPGLTRQRRSGIEVLRRSAPVDYIAFFDDDVVLDPFFLSVIAAFMESDQGRSYGAVSGYDEVGWGRPFSRLDRAYSRLGLFDGPLRPGRWLYCGHFLELEQLSDSTRDVYDADFLRGGFTVWRTAVFDTFLPPLEMPDYALGEDKHLSLRVATQYRLGVHPGARVQHLQEEGGRPGRLSMSFRRVRMHALLIRDCDPARAPARYLAFLGFTLVDCVVQLVWRISRGRLRDLGPVLTAALGSITCIVAPPRRTHDVLIVPGGR